jgi:hypothetical protein
MARARRRAAALTTLQFRTTGRRLDPLRAALGKFEAGRLPLHPLGDFKEQPAEGDEGQRDRHHKPSPFERASIRAPRRWRPPPA